MRRSAALLVLLASSFAVAQSPSRPVPMAEPESVYAPVPLAGESSGINEGGVNFDLRVNYMTDYVYRGIDHSEVGGREDGPNWQVDTRLSFDLGKLPHPFVGLFSNIYDADPQSQFQEIRPYFGAELKLKPFIFAAGHTSYIYPEREERDTAEVWGKITFDDSSLWGTERPILAPYVLGAYDYDLNNGWYFEAGVRYDLPIEDTGLTLSFIADVAYTRGVSHWFIFESDNDRGFQHYDVGMIATWSLNTLLNVSRRHGEWSLIGYLFYTDGIEDELPADTQLWGGVGIGFRY